MGRTVPAARGVAGVSAGTEVVATPHGGAPVHGRTAWLRRHGDVVAAVVLGIVPVVWFGVPAALGHAALPGDDLLQNFPLRALVGHQLRQGTLPLYDPYIWGGAPLLGGWNAGALYPFTFLFAVLPGTLAWVVNEVVVYWVAVLGLYLFLRTVGRRPSSSALAAASFGFVGAMDVQLPHFGLVAGTSWTPVILLAMVKLARATSPGVRLRWSAVLGVAGALVVLAGEPRAIATVVIVTVLFFVWLAARHARPVAPFLLSVGAGVLAAALVGAVQWLPGAEAVSTSQRAVHSYFLFGSGSLAPRWLTLGLVPGLLGGTGSFGTSAWFTGYNLPEVMSYVGLVPVAAAFGLLGSLRRRRGIPDWLIWHVVAVFGIALSLGSYTPLGHVFVHIPLFGGQRLQSRNIAITDLALAVLTAYWVDGLLDRAAAHRGRGLRAHLVGADGTADGAGDHFADGIAPGTTGRRAPLALLPLAGAATLALIGAVSPATVARIAGANGLEATHAGPQRPLLVVSAVLAVVLAVLVARAGRLAPRRLVHLLVAFVAADLLFFNLTSVWDVALSTGRAPAASPGASPAPLHLAHPIGTTGRFVMYNPNVTTDDLQAQGEPDLNLFGRTSSAQGYSSIVDGTYAAVTGSHLATGEGTNTLSPITLVNGVFDSLDTTTLVTYPSSLVAPGTISPTGGPGTRSMAPGAMARWVFGEQLDVASVSVPWAPTGSAGTASHPVRVGAQQPGGGIRWLDPAITSTDGVLSIDVPAPVPAVALVLTAPGGGTFGVPVVRTSGGGSYVAGGALQDTLDGHHWTFAGNQGPLAFFSNDDARPPLSVRGLDGAGTAGATVRAVAGPLLAPTSARVSSPHGVEVVRAVAAIPGWSATWRADGSAGPRAVPVHRTGVVQAVDLPAGAGVLTWHYAAPGFAEGVPCTLGGCLLLLVLWLSPAGARRLRRGRRRRTARQRVSIL